MRAEKYVKEYRDQVRFGKYGAARHWFFSNVDGERVMRSGLDACDRR